MKFTASLYRTATKLASACIRPLVLPFMLLALSACQFTPFYQQNTASLGQYYLWIKSLTPEELNAEIEKQRQGKQEGYEQAEVYLLLLHSLPSSQIHNPYTAKAQLNRYQLEAYSGSLFNTADLGLVVLLKDQLNQQLLLIQAKLATDKQRRQAKIALEQQREDNLVLTEKLAELTRQLKLLKNIEKNLSEREQ